MKNDELKRLKYIKKLIQYYKYSVKEEVSRNEFIELIDSMFTNYKLCKHDIHLMLQIIESFSDPDYAKMFIFYINESHQHLRKIVIEDFLILKFNAHYKKMINNYMD